jgi:Xaa-Pro aminopeptidase
MNPSQRRAIEIVRRIIPLLSVNEGQTELAVAGLIKQQLKKYGARPSFRIIVASGRRSALPHGRATSRKMKKSELVVIDFGAVYNKYCSDVTRTFVVGKPAARQKNIINIVNKAQALAIGAVRAGVKCSEVDRAAREYIKQQGFGNYFIHSTGHGIGQKVHQAPKISRRNNRRLKAGQVITIEPGIYIKGWGGIRIEDMFEVTKTGCKNLTKSKP